MPYQRKPVHKISSKSQLEFNQGTLVCPQGGFLWIPAVHSDLHTAQPRAVAGRGSVCTNLLVTVTHPLRRPTSGREK